jgi:hypothetical protein
MKTTPPVPPSWRSDLTKLDRALENSQPLRTQRLRGHGDSVVVIASPPPRTHLVISVSAARDQPPSGRGLAGVTVAVRAAPIVAAQELDEDDSATCVFDRPHLLPSPSEAVDTVADASCVVTNVSGHTPPVDLPVSGTRPYGQSPEPAWAQDTQRCVAQSASPSERPRTAGLFALSAFCLVASAIALYTGIPAAEDVPTVVLRGGAVGVQPAAVAPAVEPSLVVRPASAVEPLEGAPARPSARIEVNELTLEVTATPWMEVLLDGRSLGHTPRLGVKLTPGTHEITLVNRDLELRTETVVSAEVGASELQDIAFE